MYNLCILSNLWLKIANRTLYLQPSESLGRTLSFFNHEKRGVFNLPFFISRIFVL